MHQDITAYNRALAGDDRAVCNLLCHEIDANLTSTESKLWHGHPVWFINGNPIVGYAKRKHGVTLLFWSGQSFETPGLTKEGSFKAAEAKYASVADVDTDKLRAWIKESENIQWDYKNIVKKKGRLDRL